MTHFADGSPCTYFPAPCGDRLRAVGWLEPEHAYARGPVDRAFVVKLAALFVSPREFAIAAGLHQCRLCRFSRGTAPFQIDGLTVRMGASNLLVPAGEFAFMAPSLVLHYLDAHEYAPPPQFVEAVLQCPPTDSREYMILAKRACPQFVMAWAKPADTPPAPPSM